MLMRGVNCSSQSAFCLQCELLEQHWFSVYVSCDCFVCLSLPICFYN